MTQQARKFGFIFIAGVLSCLLTTVNLHASEKQGNLVFDAIGKMEKVNKAFLGELKRIRAKRAAATARRDVVKENYRKAKPGSINQQEFHAQYCLEEATLLSTLHDEVDLIHHASADQYKILSTLYSAIESGREAVTPQGVQATLKVVGPMLKGGRILHSSLRKISDKISDPVIHDRLDAAIKTAAMLSKYQANMEKGFSGIPASQEELKKQLGNMIQQLTAVFAQTDILGAMIKDKAAVLKTTNELAGTQALFGILSGGRGIVSNLSNDIMGPLIEAVGESDPDLNLLIDGVLRDDQSNTGNGTRHTWLDGY